MNTSTTVVGTAGVVALAQWTNDKHVTTQMVVGILVVALSLAVMTEVNAPLAEKFGTLLFITALFMYGPKVAAGLGLIKKPGGLSGLTWGKL